MGNTGCSGHYGWRDSLSPLHPATQFSPTEQFAYSTMYQEPSSISCLLEADGLPTGNAPTAKDQQATPACASDVGQPLTSLEKKIVSIENRLHCLKEGSADDLVAELLEWGKGAGESADAALSAAQYAIVYAWATGCVFNLAKEMLGHGRFGQWRDEKTIDLGISVRKAQQWMKLAKDCWDVRALLSPGAKLTGAYRATGVLPVVPPASQCVNAGAEVDPPDPLPGVSPVEPAFKALADARMRLRHLLQSDVILGKEERDRLEEEKSTFLTLVDKLLNPSAP